MIKTVDTKEYLDMVRQLLDQGHDRITVPVTGSSMIPFLHHGDTVYVSKPDSPLKPGDIVLYQRANGQYILHRIVKVHKDGSFTMLGDAQAEREILPSAHQIHARVVQALHCGKPLRPRSFRWWFFRHIWIRMVPLRHPAMKLVAKLKNSRR